MCPFRLKQKLFLCICMLLDGGFFFIIYKMNLFNLFKITKNKENISGFVFLVECIDE